VRSARINVLGLALLTAPAAVSGGPWPVPDWHEAADPGQVGISRGGVSAYLAWLGAKADGKPWGTVLIRHGKIACEYYGSGARRESRWEIGSIRKSVMSALLGMAIAEGRLSLDLPAYRVWPDIHELTRAPKDKRILLRHLATNSSGWMTGKAPGEEWLYNNAGCTAGGAVIGRAYKQPDDRVATIVSDRIAKVIGAESWEAGHFAQAFQPGNYRNPGPKLAIDSSLRDVARYGYLWLRGGEWNGTQVIPRDYVVQARQNQVERLGGHYGYWWFVNDRKVLLPDVPDDAFYHVGNGRENRRTVLLIVPSFDLVAVVGTEAGAYDITRDYARQPAASVNEWAVRVAAAVIRRP
jgi:CubicO group peptidase (beta-lactamase class C family)